MGCAASVGQFEYDSSMLGNERRSGDKLLLSPVSPSQSEKRASFKSNAITDDDHSISTARLKTFPIDPQPPTENPSRLPSIELVLTDEEKHALELAISPVPLPHNEGKRLKILKQSNILDSNTMDPEFDRFTSLAHRMFDVRIT